MTRAVQLLPPFVTMQQLTWKMPRMLPNPTATRTQPEVAAADLLVSGGATAAEVPAAATRQPAQGVAGKRAGKELLSILKQLALQEDG